jgi:hypothetical protein
LRLTHYRHGPDRSTEEIIDVVRDTWALVFSEKYGKPEYAVDLACSLNNLHENPKRTCPQVDG